MLRLREKDKEFLELVSEPVNSMKEKCNWIDDIAFNALQREETGKFVQSSVWLFPSEGHHLIVHRDKENKEYRYIAPKMPNVYLVNKSVRQLVKRIDELKNIQDELHEIDLMGRNFYDGLLYTKKSVSENFDICYTPNMRVSLWADYQLLANYSARPMKSYNKPYLNVEEKEKVLTKIEIKSIKYKER